MSDVKVVREGIRRARRTGRVVARAVAVLLGAATLGCPAPIAHTQTLSPDVSGHIVRDDGSPFAGAAVALTTAIPDHGVCRGAYARTTTDAEGRFSLGRVTKRERVTWLVPMLDLAEPSYYLCVEAGDTLRAAHRGPGALGDRMLPPDTAECQLWTRASQPNVACAEDRGTQVVQGGRWPDTAGGGSFRIYSVANGHFGTAPGVIVEWRAHAVQGSPVRASVELPLGEHYVMVRDASLWPTDGNRWCVRVDRTWTGTWTAHDDALAFELGAPGEVRPIDSCGRATSGAR